MMFYESAKGSQARLTKYRLAMSGQGGQGNAAIGSQVMMTTLIKLNLVDSKSL